VVKMSTIPEIVPFSETISHTAQEGLAVGGQLVIAKSEMPEIGCSGETSQPGQERLRVGQAVRMFTMPEVGQSDVETSQPVCFYSYSRVHFSSFPRRVIKLQVWGIRLLEVCIMYKQ
jgi:hypothetical protein